MIRWCISVTKSLWYEKHKFSCTIGMLIFLWFSLICQKNPSIQFPFSYIANANLYWMFQYQLNPKKWRRVKEIQKKRKRVREKVKIVAAEMRYRTSAELALTEGFYRTSAVPPRRSDRKRRDSKIVARESHEERKVLPTKVLLMATSNSRLRTVKSGLS